ncbi:MAG: stage II sporulation protein M [Methanobrevibacter sp.]|uniref:stage II sporulation protein M n=1 Tax=Methanobrevibacter sp. TaxID=66852 RepID=UPI002E78BB85|nr:stage II sporulation protein M [Methanobrevibacter sp.]MEE0934657.1 stage II sporulation protein M [Methanobrevibacter sp.]
MIDEVKSAFSENRLAILSSIAILFISLILGYILEPNLYAYLNPLVEDLTQKVQTGIIKLTFADIFFNNIKIVFQMFIYGMAFCFSALILAFNGFFVGYYVASADNLLYTVLLIVPHGIFEFSSCILACSSGLVLFNFIYRFLRALWREENSSVKLSLSNSFNASSDKLKQAVILLIIASILMAIAGFIEVYLTLPIAKSIISLMG